MNTLFRLRVLATLALPLAGVCRGQEDAGAAAPRSPHAAWMADAYWRDGKAEFNVYAGTLTRYGQAQPAEVLHILVREDFAPGALVKADDWRQPGAFPVLKLNQVLRVPTGVYVYQQMHSAFWRIGDGRLLKWSLTSNDSCGNTFKLAERRAAEDDGEGCWDYRFFTYWENMAEGRETVRAPAGAAAVFYDELPAWVRGLDFSGGAGSVTVQLAPGVIGSKRDRIRFAPATVHFRSDGPGGSLVVTVEHAGGRDEMTLEAAFPHRLREWRMADGGALTLKRSLKLPYWSFHNPGDRERAFNDLTLRLFQDPE